MTRQARRLRGALRPMTRDARLSAPPWRFWASGPRFRLLRRPPSYNGGQLPSGSVQRAPRSQGVVPGGRGPRPPQGRGFQAPPPDAPPPPPLTVSPETPLNERGCDSSSIDAICSQECSCDVVITPDPLTPVLRDIKFCELTSHAGPPRWFSVQADEIPRSFPPLEYIC